MIQLVRESPIEEVFEMDNLQETMQEILQELQRLNDRMDRLDDIYDRLSEIAISVNSIDNHTY